VAAENGGCGELSLSPQSASKTRVNALMPGAEAVQLRLPISARKLSSFEIIALSSVGFVPP